MDQPIEDLINKLTLAEKATLLAGADMWRTVPIEHLGIPAIQVSDGPNGVRGADDESLGLREEAQHRTVLPSERRGHPSTGQLSAAATNASCTASSARSKSPSKRTSVAQTRPASASCRTTPAIALREASGGLRRAAWSRARSSH